jgi:hypothetical protein
MKQRFDVPADVRPSLDVLIVENDPASAHLTKEAFREAGKTEGIHLVLAELKSNPRLASVPVVIVSGSDNPDEIRRAYELHASCYIRKPDDLEGFLRFIQISFDFWGSVVSFPPKRQLAEAR